MSIINVRIAAVRVVTMVTRFRALFKKEAPQFRLPEGVRIYAIGDVHGCLELLKRLEGRIEQSARDCGLNARIVFLGDYIDRGPDSRGVIEYLSGGSFAGFPASHLLGNHEDILLEALAQPALVREWLRWGGLATLGSYGVSLPSLADPAERDEAIAMAMSEALPLHHRSFLERLELSYAVGDYLFVHAGIRPGRPLHKQSRHDMLTIREPFLSSAKVFPARVVHGHSVAFDAQIAPCRIGIDTGAYATGRLSAVMLEDDRYEILSVEQDK